jgi:2'-5' RNA ligase
VSSGSDALRLFVALDLPVAVRCELAAWCSRVAPDGVRRVPAENLHLTLAFLGSRSSDDAEAVAALLPALAAAHPLGGLDIAGALWLAPRRPSVLAVAVAGDDRLGALRAALVGALVSTVAFERERRAFRPHVTVGRVARGKRVRAAALDAPRLGFAATALTLYRSHTSAGTARYEVLARIPLEEDRRAAT